MGYLVLVYASDQEAANIVRRRARTEKSKPVGIYRFPSPDDAPHPPCTGMPHRGWTRDQAGGFMRCECGGRHPRWRSRFVGALLDNLGYNLMPRDKTSKLFRNPKTHGRD